MNPILIFTYIWSAVSILDIINNKAYKHCRRTLRTGAPGNKFQLVYCYKIYFPASIFLRILIQISYFLYCFAALVTLAKYIWIHVLVDLP